ncbi:hypothetical protein AB0F71_34815 [Kitasatospora sp. NPDC028055]|uniref:hypothetical protein n=1 Tax=Kitasatospora sp. NPDC028055 TaxID=3155653 RepID=UPI0033DFE156
MTQIVTLVGVLLGALTSFVATGWAERTKHQRAMATLWEAEIAAREHAGEPNGVALIELLNAYHAQARLDLGGPSLDR